MRVLFVGSNPSRKNLNSEQPFIGSPSGKVLLQWIAILEIKDYTMVNVSDKLDGPIYKRDMNLGRLDMYVAKHDYVIALGRTAHNALRYIKASHMLLPHPSPRNRLLNDKELINQWLGVVKSELYA